MEKDIEIKAVISKYQIKRNRSRKQIAAYLDLSVASLNNRVSRPENFKVGELRRLYDYLQIPEMERQGL